MAKIELTITDEETEASVTRSVTTGDSAWTDPKFFQIAARTLAVKLSEAIHVETEEETLNRHREGWRLKLTDGKEPAEEKYDEEW